MAKSQRTTSVILEELKTKQSNQITRDDIAGLLKSIGKPGQQQEKKIRLISELSLENNQGHTVDQTLHSYKEF